MRLFRFLVIFLVFSFVFAACSSGEDDLELENGGNDSENKSSDNGNGDGESVNGDQNRQNLNCGNGITDDGEVCDGNAQECSLADSKYTGGFATCKADCSGWDVSNCRTVSNDGGEDGNNDGNGNNNQNAGFDKNSNGIWVDPDTYLIWENPMGNQGTGGVGPTHTQAAAYCENLVLAGTDDWRLPTIDELRTLVRGVSTTMTGGKCPTSESCTDQDSCNKDKENKHGFGNSCLGCDALDSQYDSAISYLTESDCRLSDINFENGEYYIVPAMFTDPYRLWSSTKNTGLAGSAMQAFWYLNYKSGQINSGSDSTSNHWVRCVRTGTAADVPEQDAEVEHDPSWECIVEADCSEGQWCQNHKCVTKPKETYVAANGLEWQAGQVERIEGWGNAAPHCENLEYAGHDDWRLPNITELKSLVTGCAKTNECPVTAEAPEYPGNYSTVCKTCSSGNYMPQEVGQQIEFPYWTSTNDPSKTNRVWAINFMTGAVFYSYNTANHYARCVRGTMN
ncbi:DUF1566 domain-containing protein [bacterium]|nr:DUF1566 domain-containing protein [bacterium]